MLYRLMGTAMLSATVNIAVFAVFRIHFAGRFVAIAAFKRVCRDRQLDIWRYGRQKRQDRGKNGKVCGNGFAVFGEGGKRWRLKPRREHATTMPLMSRCVVVELRIQEPG